MLPPDRFDFFLPGSPKKGVLLVHGLTGSPSEMRFVGKQLHKMGFTVYAPTLAGHCQDEAALLATTYEDWIASIHKALEVFESSVEEIYMAGICVGGALALMAAQHLPHKVKGVAIYAPTLNYDGWNTPFYYPLTKYCMPLLKKIPFIRRIRFAERHPFGVKSDRVRNAIMGGKGEGIEGTLPYFPAMALYQNFRLNQALARALPGITTPTLLLHARADDVSHPRNAYAIAKLHGGRCEVQLLEDSYHMIHVDQERKKVAALTADFFGIPQHIEHSNLLQQAN